MINNNYYNEKSLLTVINLYQRQLGDGNYYNEFEITNIATATSTVTIMSD